MKTITLSVEDWNKIADVVSSYWDECPTGEGWQSDELVRASANLSAALARTSSSAASQWQQIETAPTQRGTQILGWCGGAAETLEYDGGYWVQVSDSGRATAFDPTHWMPLPEPPNESSVPTGETTKSPRKHPRKTGSKQAADSRRHR